MQPTIEHLDALLLLNQDADLVAIAHRCREAGCKRALIVSSHYMFEAERAEFDKVFGGEFRATTFNEWLDDAALAACDERATAELQLRGGKTRAPQLYASRFMLRSVWHKNAALNEALRRRCAWRMAFHTPGLGICAAFWSERGSAAIGAVREVRFTGFTLLVERWRVLARFLTSATALMAIQAGPVRYLFTSMKRLRIAPSTAIENVMLKPLAKLQRAVRLFTLDPLCILAGTRAADTIVATTIHDYMPLHASSERQVAVFIDGFHPSNYPRTYLDQFGPGYFVSADPLSCEWFRKYDRIVQPPPPFMDSARMHAPLHVERVRTVLLALNHAGDWTALINRSDTDILVEQFCAAAKDFPHLRFVVRPHPTMALPSHEGVGSRARLERFVNSHELDNLSMSNGTLSDDVAAADLIVSEYSQVLIDGWRLGKLGLIANLTARRSFMVDFEACGFASVSDPGQLRLFLSSLAVDLPSLITRQHQAVETYNRLVDSTAAGRPRGRAA